MTVATSTAPVATSSLRPAVNPASFTAAPSVPATQGAMGYLTLAGAFTLLGIAAGTVYRKLNTAVATPEETDTQQTLMSDDEVEEAFQKIAFSTEADLFVRS